MLLYQSYQAQLDLAAPVRAAAGAAVRLLDELPCGLSDDQFVRRISGAYEMVARAGLTHVRPSFGIDTVKVGRTLVEVHEEVVDSTPFGSLLRFRKDLDVEQPRVLVVAALAGHFSTLLRPTVRTLLPDHDVYITDWHNARDVSVRHGSFDLDGYIEHVIRFIKAIGPGAHVVAVCQPCPATLAAAAVLAEANDPALPRSITLMAGPVDPRMNPTKVNELATGTPLSWFERNVIATVPFRYEGAHRRVYPGFLQLSAFVGMNISRHVRQHFELYNGLVRGELAKADRIKDFYDEYFAVLDMPAEFYLQTIDKVFQRHLLPIGALTYKGEPVHLGAIKGAALLTVEGERDDICGVGQTSAALDLCTGIKRTQKRHHLQPGVGHYGVFSGSGWDRQIYPVLRNFVLAHN
jgi:poly(3-hydroxybutyrate) depolymerase